MLHLSLIPFIFVAQMTFLFWAGKSARVAMTPLWVIAVSLTAWGFLSAFCAISGVYDDPRFLALLPGLWLPAIPIVLVSALLIFRPVRSSLMGIAQIIPAEHFILLQAIRITAIGTLIKTLQGEFPVSVELAIGLTDLAFGFSALLIFWLARAGRISADAIALWHIVGILIIIIPGELAIQTALPGPLEVFSKPPTATVMLDYPMVLAPSLVVPIFLLFNMVGALTAMNRNQRPLNKHQSSKQMEHSS